MHARPAFFNRWLEVLFTAFLAFFRALKYICSLDFVLDPAGVCRMPTNLLASENVGIMTLTYCEVVLLCCSYE